MLSKLLMALRVEALESGSSDGSVHSLDLSVIRCVIRGAFLVRLCFSKNGIMVCPSGTRGAGSTKVRADAFDTRPLASILDWRAALPSTCPPPSPQCGRAGYFGQG